jgi:hypothetical protein
VDARRVRVLRHLERVGYPYAPRLVGTGFDPTGRATLTFVEGGFTQPGPRSLDGGCRGTAANRSLRNRRVLDIALA